MAFPQVVQLLSFFVAAFASVYVFIWLILMSPLVNAFTDRPDERKVHQRLVPRAGGVCIVAAVLGLVLLWSFLDKAVIPPLPERVFRTLFLTGAILGTVGVLDDTIYINISALGKLILQIGVAAGLIIGSGVRFETIPLFGGIAVSLGPLGFPISLLWLVGVTNAINIIDGLDGLAGTISLISFASLAVFTGMEQDYRFMLVTLLFAGAIFAFLLHNAPPARTFLGDTGSMFIGMALGFLTMYLIAEGPGYPVITAPLIVAFPILDVAVAMMRRFVKARGGGASWVRSLEAMLAADNEHIHHRLLQRGFQHSWVVCTIALLHGTVCAAAILIQRLSAGWAAVALAYVTGMAFWYLHQLGFLAPLAGRYRVRRELEARRRRKDRDLIGIVQADPVLQHALTHYEQELFAFEILSIRDMPWDHPAIRRWSAVILENHYDNRLAEDIDSARKISRIAGCPVFVLGDGVGLTGWKVAHTEGTEVTFINKPVYVPVVLKKLAESIGQTREKRASEKVVSPALVAQTQRELSLRNPGHENV
ncbi:MAG: hypothetical protein GF344_11865 [Chitinivibrionales bacterium]|nr:hypothetical protein [Chitinivibrionales bacterium]MBD3357482.1 hypothetical protein [Chitinivibrionales bacterium]